MTLWRFIPGPADQASDEVMLVLDSGNLRVSEFVGLWLVLSDTV